MIRSIKGMKMVQYDVHFGDIETKKPIIVNTVAIMPNTTK